VPEPSEPVSIASELRVVVEPEDLLVFSGAHLHASVPNAAGVARFRATNTEDGASGRGAPNLEGEAPRVALDWFRKVMDGMLLPVAMRNRD
jgi:hypothetical protein